MKAATDEAYRRFPDPHDANLGSTRYGFIEGALWAGKEIERLTAENERRKAALEACVEFWSDPDIPCPIALHDMVTDAIGAFQQQAVNSEE